MTKYEILYYGGGDSVVIADAASNDDVAEVFHNERHTVTQSPEYALATARLFAAAPDLLAALELLVGEELGGDAHSHKPSEAYRAYINWNDRAAARAAIDRAKGDTA